MKNEKRILWQRRIEDKKSSGLKLDEWCAKNQLTKHAYFYWKRKLADIENCSSQAPLFIEVPVEKNIEYDVLPGTLLIQWNKLSIHAADSYSVNLAVELLDKLQKLC